MSKLRSKLGNLLFKLGALVSPDKIKVTKRSKNVRRTKASK